MLHLYKYVSMKKKTLIFHFHFLTKYLFNTKIMVVFPFARIEKAEGKN